MLVELRRPNMDFVILDRQIRAEAQIDEVERLSPEHAHDSVQHVEVMSLRVLLRRDIHDTIVLDRRIGLRRRLALPERSEQESRRHAEAVHLRVGRGGSDAARSFPGDQ